MGVGLQIWESASKNGSLWAQSWSKWRIRICFKFG